VPVEGCVLSVKNERGFFVVCDFFEGFHVVGFLGVLVFWRAVFRLPTTSPA
jgi:hypothetical protein